MRESHQDTPVDIKDTDDILVGASGLHRDVDAVDDPLEEPLVWEGRRKSVSVEDSLRGVGGRKRTDGLGEGVTSGASLGDVEGDVVNGAW